MKSWPERKAEKLSWVLESDSQQLQEVLGAVNEEQLSLPPLGERNTARKGSKQWPQRAAEGKRKGGKGSNA
jgi:hypothetical protein